jgi:S1-C subfamily serine protease
MSPERLKAACISVRAPARHGTAYLVAPTTLATCHHVVESAGKGGEVELLFPGGVRTARVVETDERTDCAILQLAEPLPGGEPLPLAGRSEGRAQWDGFGFPSLAAGAGLPFFGMVLDPEALDDLGRPVVTLYSDMLAAGMAAPAHGLSGGPVVVGGAVVGHFSRVVGTPGRPGQPALGVIYAARASNVLALLGTPADVATAQSQPVPALADVIPKASPGGQAGPLGSRDAGRGVPPPW